MSPSSASFELEPGIILGAGRSGTKILRDALTALPGAGTWPCDEINYIWRHGNARHPNDELGPEHATPQVRRYIRKAFADLARRQDFDRVIEKTCANSLRVSFVAEVFPEARYVFLVRDGRDVVVSAMERWRAPLNLSYILRKARYVPPSDIPYYGLRYLWNRLQRMASRERRLAFWGPRFEGMEESRRTESLAVVCARQWRRCVEKAAEDLSRLPERRVHRLSYEALVINPEKELDRLARFLEIEGTQERIHAIGSRFHAESVGRWRKQLSDEQKEALLPILEEPLEQLGYEVD